MKIYQKLITSFLLVAGLTLIVGVFGVTAILNNEHEFDKVTTQQTPIINALEDVRLATINLAASTTNVILQQDIQANKIQEKIEQLNIAINNYELAIDEFPHDEINLTIDEFPHDEINLTTEMNNEIQQLKNLSQELTVIHLDIIVQNTIFSENYDTEKEKRYEIRTALFPLNNAEINKQIGNMQYYSKETLYQHKDQERLDDWIQSIKDVQSNVERIDFDLRDEEKIQLLSNLESYDQIAQNMGSIVIQNQKSLEKELKLLEEFKNSETKIFVMINNALEHEFETLSMRQKSISDELNTTSSMIYFITVLTFGSAAIFGVFISRAISKPISRLQKAAKSISEGNYDLNLVSKSSDEIGDLETSFKNMIDVIKEQQKNKNEFMAMITHELKTPLQPIQGYAYLLKDNMLGELNEKQKKAVDEIGSNSFDLLRLIDNLLDVQKLEMKKMDFNKEIIPITDFMQNIHQDLEPLMVEKKIEFVNTANKDVLVVADTPKLKGVFTNLIQNSVDFVPDKNGKIEFGVYEETTDYVTFYVKDNGPGVSEEQEKNLFKKFWQADTSLTRKHGGTGLGLPICKGYVEGMGGKIWAKNQKGSGLIVHFNLPKASNGNPRRKS